MIIKGAIKCVNYDENIILWEDVRLKFKLIIFYGKTAKLTHKNKFYDWKIAKF